MKDYNFDCIVVGAGPSGVSAAITLKKGGASVLLVDRADFLGSKNMIGGAINLTALKEVFPDDYKSAPIERYINSHAYSLLSKDKAVEIKYQGNNDNKLFTTYRQKFDAWMIELAKNAGVYFAPNTTVRNLIVENDFVVGIDTGEEKIYSKIVILADGVNSLLAEQIGLKKPYEPKDVVLSVKESRKLPSDIIEQRFNLKDSTDGATKMFIGGLDIEDAPFAMGFLYTYKDSISIGLGVSLEDLTTLKMNPSELLDKLKVHPTVDGLIKDSELLEYSAHLIPECGYNKLPKRYDNGVMLIGDAAGFVNAIHFEGTNFAFISGKVAAQSALLALDVKNYSKRTLSIYKKNLEKTFVLKDLKAYKNVFENLSSRKDSLINYYPQKAVEFFEIITGATCKPKKDELNSFIKNFVKNRNISQLIIDVKTFVSTVFGVLK